MPHLPPTQPGHAPIEITLRRSARARRFSLRVSRLDGRVTLSLPPRAREADALAFAREQESWIRQTLAQMPGRRVLVGCLTESDDPGVKPEGVVAEVPG